MSFLLGSYLRICMFVYTFLFAMLRYVSTLLHSSYLPAWFTRSLIRAMVNRTKLSLTHSQQCSSSTPVLSYTQNDFYSLAQKLRTVMPSLWLLFITPIVTFILPNRHNFIIASLIHIWIGLILTTTLVLISIARTYDPRSRSMIHAHRNEMYTSAESQSPVQKPTFVSTLMPIPPRTLKLKSQF